MMNGLNLVKSESFKKNWKKQFCYAMLKLTEINCDKTYDFKEKSFCEIKIALLLNYK